ncbi:MAG: DNA mismatch repair protein MutL [Verrucomicrobiia bacterium Tous-C2TDCM]|jgi:DNA mismatch repair protein MutL|nr:MAG: DNA mismatch repair protein MutL [Verrucomicrobiae bacterium Tous-C2TDCM]
MGKIRLLHEALACQVAAGEVVERPASVVKELVENSLDAGATNIEVRVQRGGIALIRVTDDGCGMDRDDALMCLERNATSKIRTKEDLGAITTLGFRGEAIPSIASVSKFRLTTREPGSLTGTEVIITGGKLEGVNDCGESPGTQIEVRSLFFNLPARRKFLRTEATEYAHLEQVLKTQAIAHERVRFSLVRDERLAFQLPATTSLRERIGGLVGDDLASRLLEIEPLEQKGVKVCGFIGPPGMGRSDRRQQLTFLNGRPVEAAIVTRAMREGYHTALMKGQYPVTFLFLETDPGAVDVNVHPAKREVRFHDGFAVQDAIVAAVSRTLRERMIRPVSGVGLTGASSTPRPLIVQDELIEPATVYSTPRLDPRPAQLFTALERQRVEQTPTEKGQAPDPTLPDPDPTEQIEPTFPDPPATAAEEKPKATDYRIIGVLGKLYVLLEAREGLVLMDQHAAHERVLFEELRRRMELGGAPSQRLLAPLMVDLPPRDFDLVSRHLETLERLGFGAEPFGGNTLKIDALPAFLKRDDPEAFLHEVIQEIRVASDRMSSLRLGEDLIATTVCRAAVKANDFLKEPELRKLLEDLLQCDMPYCCPHGRPTLIQIGYPELERKFGRRA